MSHELVDNNSKEKQLANWHGIQSLKGWKKKDLKAAIRDKKNLLV